MANYVIRVKVLPNDPGISTDRLLDSIAERLGPDLQLKGKIIEPIAFGLSSLILDIIAPEIDGIIERVENSVSSSPLVGHYELIGVSRATSTLH